MAWRFARFVASAEAAEIFARAQRSIPAHVTGQASFAAGSEPRRAGMFLEAMAFSRVQPITLKWDEMDSAMNNALGDLTRGRSDADATLRRMADNLLTRGVFPVRWPDGRLEQPRSRP
jgi:hypothetical protein